MVVLDTLSGSLSAAIRDILENSMDQADKIDKAPEVVQRPPVSCSARRNSRHILR
jgi:hypothetical protein